MLLGMTNAVELTFELPDSAKECFFEIIQEGTESTVEYQVSQVLYLFHCYKNLKLLVKSSDDLFVNKLSSFLL